MDEVKVKETVFALSPSLFVWVETGACEKKYDCFFTNGESGLSMSDAQENRRRKAALRRTYFGKSLFISSSLLYNSIVFGGIAVKGCKGHLPPFCANMEVRRAVVIHLGADKPVRAEDILLMIDLTRGWAEDTADMVARMQEKRLVRTLSPKPKTLVMCREGARTICCLTGVGLRTLSARMREDRGFYLRLMQSETERSEVQHVERTGSGD